MTTEQFKKHFKNEEFTNSLFSSSPFIWIAKVVERDYLTRAHHLQLARLKEEKMKALKRRIARTWLYVVGGALALGVLFLIGAALSNPDGRIAVLIFGTVGLTVWAVGHAN